MKETLTLTQEQIAQLTKAKTNQLIIEKEKKIKAIEKDFENALLKLKNRFTTIKVDVDNDEENVVSSFNTIKPFHTIILTNDLLTAYYNEGKSIKEIEELSGKKQQAIRIQLNKLGLKMKDRK